MPKTRVLIMGAAGRDFHNFNVVFRADPAYEVVAFTATQIPGIADRRYPAAVAGPLYPDGIPIYPERDLTRLIREQRVDRVVFAYSDVTHEHVMHRASETLAAGADFWLLGPNATMLRSQKPVVAVCAVRTGCGKSQTTRRVVAALREMGQRVVVVRHPMPYGDLAAQAVQRFADYADLDRHQCTLEEREEYEPHLDAGAVVYAGVDYERVLRAAEAEADVVVWDGGNNDLPFFKPDVHLTVVDPLRPGHETRYYPGETNLRLADAVVINKENTATTEGIEAVRGAVRIANPGAVIIDAASEITVDAPELIRGQRVVVVEDGPTVTHGEMAYGAGMVAARQYGAAEIVSPAPYAVGSIADTFAAYPHAVGVLPAMGYGAAQVADLTATLAAMPVDAVVIGTPIDLRRVVRLAVPAVRVRYELRELSTPTVADVVRERLSEIVPLSL